jgi:hypothetical protein
VIREHHHTTSIGTIVVLVIFGAVAFATIGFLKPNASPAPQGAALAAGEKIPYDNADELEEYIKKFGVKAVMTHLVAESGGGSIFDCHQEAHRIGRVGYNIEKESAFGSCNASCHSGCYHGAMESLLNEQGTKNLAATISAVCEKFTTSFGAFECLHGVGHGVLAYLDYDLPESLNECAKLGGSFAQTSCYGGVFMENILTGQGLGASEEANHETQWVNRNDPYFPCNAIDQSNEVQYQCWQMQTSWMLTLASYNFDTVAKQCLDAPNGMAPTCFKSFGRDVAGSTLRNPVKMKELCEKIPEDGSYRLRCVEGAVNVVIDFWGPTLGAQASDFCRILNPAEKKTCYETLAARLPGVFGDAASRNAACERFEPEFRNLCIHF